MPVVIVENDKSKWDDVTGAVYHFPKNYRSKLEEGDQAIYYKARIRDKIYASKRPYFGPHYFAKARIGKIYADRRNDDGASFALIKNYTPFESPVPFKVGRKYLETVIGDRPANYWRNSVRPISQIDYGVILSRAKLLDFSSDSAAPDRVDDFKSYYEGSESTYFGTRYERRKDLRAQAIAIHGLDCKACGFNFERAYGEYAKNFVHVHHVVPISEFDGVQAVDPETDLVTLCANCHAVVHRKRDVTLSVDELKGMLRGRWIIDSSCVM